MARSASRALVAGVVACAAAGALTGCVTTQDRSARAELTAKRLLASRKPLVLGAAEPRVRVDAVTRVAGGGGGALVVRLTNTSAAALTDVPLLVGVGRRTLNGKPGQDYFDAHVPAIGAGATVEWVFRAPKVPAGRPFARIGAPVTPPISSARSLPALRATVVGIHGTRAQVRVVSSSAVPQVQLQVAAVQGDRAAGRAVVAHLGSRGSAVVPVRLVGHPRPGPISVHALPTIFR